MASKRKILGARSVTLFLWFASRRDSASVPELSSLILSEQLDGKLFGASMCTCPVSPFDLVETLNL